MFNVDQPGNQSIRPAYHQSWLQAHVKAISCYTCTTLYHAPTRMHTTCSMFMLHLCVFDNRLSPSSDSASALNPKMLNHSIIAANYRTALITPPIICMVVFLPLSRRSLAHIPCTHKYTHLSTFALSHTLAVFSRGSTSHVQET